MASRFNIYSKIFICLFLYIIPLQSQTDYDSELKRNRSRLNSIKSEIDRLKKEISKIQIEESNVVIQLKMINEEMALIGQAKGLLVREQKILQKKIDQTNAELRETQKRYDDLKKLYGKRAVYAYKYSRVKNLELILTSESFSQAFIRYKYLRLIAENDQRTIETIHRKKQAIEEIKAELDKNLKRMEENIREKQREESNYLVRLSQREVILKKLKWSESQQRRLLSDKEAEREKLDNIIYALERSRRVREGKGDHAETAEFDFDDFRKAKGRLPWPVQGKVVTHYGKTRDPFSKTYINNTDIEISSSAGTKVQSVFKGLVRVITYLPGYGNTLIIDHGQGFYTVYSHLDEIYVEKDEIVGTGHIIGTVRDAVSLSGDSRLGFGIYSGNETFNPESWLK
ncbi:MAG: peptidoglycan DD-metalloendopeptidase family protein [Calditrichaceae bacterium]|nr:peptidoglycan DD-metalloendopeptidase family protein [Calditrichaceae bacterium]MBN2707763.1 peptidoglycan DD-metalloendopeptidase family protein [Calditrichaceae bacterium]